MDGGRGTKDEGKMKNELRVVGCGKKKNMIIRIEGVTGLKNWKLRK